MNAYSVGRRCLLGLILAGNMILKAYILSEGEFEVYSPSYNQDLSEIRDLIHVMTVLNAFIHSHCSEMSEELCSTLPVVRSRSSVVSTPSYYTSGSEHGYSLQLRGTVSQDYSLIFTSHHFAIKITWILQYSIVPKLCNIIISICSNTIRIRCSHDKWIIIVMIVNCVSIIVFNVLYLPSKL